MIEIPAEEPPLPDVVVDGAIRLADIHARDRVTIIGRGHLDLLLGLNRRGILSASCEMPDRGPLAAVDDVDVVWMPGVGAPAMLLTVLARFGRHLRPGGAVVIGPDLPKRGADSSWPRRVLFERGFTSVAQVHLGVDAGVLLCARKRLAAVRKAA